MMPKLIDTHAHLEEIDDLKKALEEAREAGVEAVIAVGQGPQSNRELLDICPRYKDILPIYPAMGVHPGYVEGCDPEDALSFIEENIKDIVALGEIGLDYWYKPARKEGPGRQLQNLVFEKQLDMAKRYDKPVVVHSRGAWRACLEMLSRYDIKEAEFHWYSGPQDVLEELLERGYCISATPAAEYSPEHKSAIARAPLEKIFLETDSPVRYKPAEGEYFSRPKDVFRTLKAVAEIKKISEDQIAQVCNNSSMEFFGLQK
ncbi:MAG: TatD family hydrolase [Candidatus Omnitrophica bacterium]|nr:TatD family hydrolase [Candidatus Omnitrophota bacterium]